MRAIVSREVSGDYFILSGGGGVGFGIVDPHLVRDYYSQPTRRSTYSYPDNQLPLLRRKVQLLTNEHKIISYYSQRTQTHFAPNFLLPPPILIQKPI
jgi:hypothetical protein